MKIRLLDKSTMPDPPKGWHSAVRHVFNGVFDAYEDLRRNNPGTDARTLNKWLANAILRAAEKWAAFDV